MDRPRFALRFDGQHLERWHLTCLTRLEESATLAGVIVASGPPPAPGRAEWNGSPVLARYAAAQRAREAVDIPRRLSELPRWRVDSEPELLAGAELDFVFQLGRGADLRSLTMAPAPRLGVWCFQHELDADRLPFFREVYEGDDITHAALISLGDSGERPTILEEGWFRTERRSYRAHRERMQWSLAEWPARVCRRLWAQMGSVNSPERTTGIATSPSRAAYRPSFPRFVARIAGRRVRFALQRLFRHPQWNIGILRIPASALLRPEGYADDRIEWFPLAGRDVFLADPFGVARGGKVHALCEEFSYRASKGRISAVEWSARGFSGAPAEAIRLPVHASYPCLVEDQGEVWCIPETSQAGEIALFRAVEFPRRWEKVVTLLQGFAGLDPTVFQHAGRWWLMATERGPEEDAALRLWHAADLRGPWTPHARNPVKTDVRSARPGGLPFVHEGALYRPAQDCSRSYGWRVVIQRVTALTPSTFAEEPVAVLEPSPGSAFPLGRHTLTPVGDMVLLDGHRAVFVAAALRTFLRIWARDLFARLRRTHRPAS
jgi:hypothetical protein